MTLDLEKLESRLAQTSSQSEKIDVLNDLSEAVRLTRVDLAREYSQRACELACEGEFIAQPYTLGLARSLIGLGYLDLLEGKLDESLRQCLQAVDLLQDRPMHPCLCDAYSNISGVYFYLGDYARSMENSLRGLELARQMQSNERQARILGSLGLIYIEMNDLPSARQVYREALDIARLEKNTRQQAVILNNLAMALLRQDDLPAARISALQSLELARRHSLTVLEAVVLDTIGQVMLATKEYPQARQYLEQALVASQQVGRPLHQLAPWINLGKLAQAQMDWHEAWRCFEQALEISQQLHTPAEEAQAHRGLSQVAEVSGEWQVSLQHFKQFYALREAVSNEEGLKRQAVLRLTHQLENARLEAELQRQHNQALQREIEERKRVEAALETLATVDSLTGVFNRRHFHARAQHELERSARYNRPLLLLVMDVDHFKGINDRFGHLTGDEALIWVARTLRQNLREVDLVARFGGDEFIALIPESSSDQALPMAERIRKQIASQHFSTLSGELQVTVSIGVTCLMDADQSLADPLEALIHRADEALYLSKNNGRNHVTML